MNVQHLTRPALAFSLVMLATPIKRALLSPVSLPGQATQQSPADQAVSLRNYTLNLLRQRLLSFEVLADNWDGYGAVPPSAQVVGHATTLLQALPGEWVLHLGADDLTPTPYGTVTLEWANGPNYVSVEMGDDQWAYIAEVGGEIRRSANAAYPDAALRHTVNQALWALFPSAVPHERNPYTA